jgi:hypothetical protein
VTGTAEPYHRVVLDANVFFIAPVRDFLLTGAWELRLIEVCWSAAILAEVERNWARVTGTERAAERWQRLASALQRAFPDALVPSVTMPVVSGYPGVSAEDWHVVETALVAQATGIVTFNRRHFPVRSLATLGLQPWSPDGLFLDLYRRDAENVLATLSRQGTYFRRPRSLQGTLIALAPRCPRFVAAIRASSNLG